ncbi:MAG TPA: protein translocase subunit SecD [Acidimicrobiia bacterium]|nr:protein translocase subunit SecD [Acidimicrobiia bacterium]
MRTYLVVTFLVVAISFGATIASGDEPVLGLDLQGGISVVLAPVGKFKAESLDVAVDIIRDRVDGLGVAEPEISRQGDNIVVDLPGVKDRNKARRVVGQTAELRFRPVLAELPAPGATVSTTTTTVPSITPADPTATTTPPVDEAATTTTTTATADGSEAAKAAVASCDPNQIAALLTAGTEVPNTTRADDRRSACVVLPLRDGQGGAPRLLLGPTELTGNGVDSARSRFAQGEGYAVSVRFTDKGATAFDALAAASFPKSPPENQVAIVLDGEVQSAPAFQAASFSGDVQITGSFTPDEASDLATIINYGALPVQLEELTVQNVSPTLGQDQLDAGIAAGLIGLLLVALYMVAYYRLLGLVVVIGLLMTGALVYALISYLGTAIGLTLTLAGVTGLIVSVGVTVDSYVVYFERLKDEVRTGRTVRSSVDRGFARSFRTIIAADLVSLIGALVLYFLAIGSVRGFAFFLGLSTILDLAVSYFFMHPLVALLARRPALVRMRGIGIAAGLDAPEVRA